MEKAAKRMRGSVSGMICQKRNSILTKRKKTFDDSGQELGGEFPIKNVITGEGGLIQVCLEGICLTFENNKVNLLNNSISMTSYRVFEGVYRITKNTKMYDTKRRSICSRRIR